MKTIKLQEDVRLIASGGTKGRPIYLVEEAPRHRLASYKGELYHLPLPWVYSVVIYNDVEAAYYMLGHNLRLKNTVMVQSLYCSPKKIRNDEDSLDWLPIANSVPHQVCDFGMKVNKDADRLEVINSGINSFWAANGNGYLGAISKLQEQLSPSLKGARYYQVATPPYAEWETKSIEEVLACSYGKLITMGELRTRVVKDTLDLKVGRF